MAKKKAMPANGDWHAHDEALLYTCYLTAALASGMDLGRVPEVSAPFPAVNAAGERLWAAGPFVLSDFRPLGDGSWEVSSSMVFGTGAFGFGLMAGSLVAGAAARSRAMRAAQAAAVPRWVPIERGVLFASQYGFYLHTPRLLRWDWPGITSAAMVGPALVHITGNSETGPISWLLQSDWAELIFATWAMARYPRHPQLISGGWLPPGWVQRAHTLGRLPATAPGVVSPPALPAR